MSFVHEGIRKLPGRWHNDLLYMINKNYILGIPVIDFNFKNTTTYDTYPLYHTMYETPFTNEHLLDTHDFAVKTSMYPFKEKIIKVKPQPSLFSVHQMHFCQFIFLLTSLAHQQVDFP
uniref:COesterase domain-containing protein n=1 Tax=Heterorhabditis bacteriophora TaxID=37862 RepID=A0A1I7X2Q1_HETBA